MEWVLQGTAVVLLAVGLNLVLRKQEKELSILLTLVVCCLVVALAARYLEPVIDFIRELREVGNLDNEMLSILLKAVGIGFLAEIASLVCTDAGDAALGKALQMLSAAAILWLSLPMLSSLLELVSDILGEV